ncbi:hypothetical protein NPIL_77821 [Nephila pilipes]|uniref:Uncharacterized protein n=1 Tax=Nephila pilipes TaxID=299642 RepID=A0A8X6QFK0_NEPPI|nr:hypothetical protein NPIL_77821 [Nephila pilipes]
MSNNYSSKKIKKEEKHNQQPRAKAWGPATQWKCQPYWPSVSSDVSLLQVKIWNSNTELLPSLPNDSGNGNAVPKKSAFLHACNFQEPD